MELWAMFLFGILAGVIVLDLTHLSLLLVGWAGGLFVQSYYQTAVIIIRGWFTRKKPPCE